MPEQIKWTLNVEVSDGPKMSASKTETVDAYDKIEAEIPEKQDGASGKKTVEVQPGETGKVKFLLIKSSLYHEKLTYKAKDGSGTSGPIKLDSLQLLIGDGAVKLLGKAPQQLLFENAVEEKKVASIEILVGREATS